MTGPGQGSRPFLRNPYEQPAVGLDWPSDYQEDPPYYEQLEFYKGEPASYSQREISGVQIGQLPKQTESWGKSSVGVRGQSVQDGTSSQIGIGISQASVANKPPFAQNEHSGLPWRGELVGDRNIRDESSSPGRVGAVQAEPPKGTLDVHLISEWEALRRKFEAFKGKLEANLNRWTNFGPVEDGGIRKMESPFGPALQFRTYSVAGIWMNFYMGLIHLYRTEPSLPPEPMIAAGLAASRTLSFADHIGRIAAGLMAEIEGDTRVNPAQGAALIESCFPLFTAGLQVSDET